MRKSLRIVFVLLAGLVTAPAFAAEKAEIGKKAPGFTLPDQNGRPVSLSDYHGKIVVLEWINPDCPFVQRHYESKTMTTLASRYADKGIVWLAINTNGDPKKNAAFASQHGLPYPILQDTGEVGKAYAAKTTPHMFIIDRDGKLAYAGGIDNDPNGDKGQGRVNYVQKALDDLLSGSSVATPETKSYGCGVKYAK